MIVVDTDAVHDHATVMIVLDAAGVALAAVVHARKLEHFAAFLAIFELPLVFHAEVYEALRQVIVVEYHRVKSILRVYLKRDILDRSLVDQFCVLNEPIEFLLQSIKTLV